MISTLIIIYFFFIPLINNMHTYQVSNRSKTTDDYQKYYFKLIALEFDIDSEN